VVSPLIGALSTVWKWGFHGVTAYAGYVPAGPAAPRRGEIVLDWLSDAVVVAGPFDPARLRPLDPVRPATA
jgi:hypothetical protein